MTTSFVSIAAACRAVDTALEENRRLRMLAETVAWERDTARAAALGSRP